MATTHIHRSSPAQQRNHQRRDERASTTAVWIIVALAIIAAITVGYFTSDESITDRTPMVQTQPVTTPAMDGSTSSMVGAPAADSTLTPSVMSPGSPDTTTTESSNIPADGIH